MLWKRNTALMLAFAAAGILAGCAEVSYESGRLPGAPQQAAKPPGTGTAAKSARAAATQTAILESRLTMGVSSKSDVRAVLGEPNGRGEIMIPLVDKSPREMWTYYYDTGRFRAEEGKVVGDSRRFFMMIYFDAQGRFDGYQWFSSLPQHALGR